MPKGKGFRTVNDYRAVPKLIAPSAMPMPRLEESAALLGGVTVFCTLDIIQGYSQAPLHPGSREVYTMVIIDVLYTPHAFCKVSPTPP